MNITQQRNINIIKINNVLTQWFIVTYIIHVVFMDNTKPKLTKLEESTQKDLNNILKKFNCPVQFSLNMINWITNIKEKMIILNNYEKRDKDFYLHLDEFIIKQINNILSHIPYVKKAMNNNKKISEEFIQYLNDPAKVHIESNTSQLKNMKELLDEVNISVSILEDLSFCLMKGKENMELYREYILRLPNMEEVMADIMPTKKQGAFVRLKKIFEERKASGNEKEIPIDLLDQIAAVENKEVLSGVSSFNMAKKYLQESLRLANSFAQLLKEIDITSKLEPLLR